MLKAIFFFSLKALFSQYSTIFGFCFCFSLVQAKICSNSLCDFPLNKRFLEECCLISKYLRIFLNLLPFEKTVQSQKVPEIIQRCSPSPPPGFPGWGPRMELTRTIESRASAPAQLADSSQIPLVLQELVGVRIA